jgi:hypothetical protein
MFFVMLVEMHMRFLFVLISAYLTPTGVSSSKTGLLVSSTTTCPFGITLEGSSSWTISSGCSSSWGLASTSTTSSSTSTGVDSGTDEGSSSTGASGSSGSATTSAACSCGAAIFQIRGRNTKTAYFYINFGFSVK